MIMNTKFLILVLTTFNIINATAQQNWSLDKSHSNVFFTVDHLVVSEVTGTFDT